MQLADWLLALGGFFIAILVGTFVEYAVHRLMHTGTVLGKKHAHHHQDGHGQGWFGEFKDYFFPTFPVSVVVLVVSYFVGYLAFGAGFAIGGTFYAIVAAYAHQVQHERPELVFWLRRPVHYLHHKHKMWKHNFGITVDFWDRLFGTYKVVEWNPEKRPFQHPLSYFFRIKWF